MKACKDRHYFMPTTKLGTFSLLSNQASVLTGEQAEIPCSQAEDYDLDLTSEIFISTFIGKLLPVSYLWTQSCVDEDWSNISCLETTQRESRKNHRYHTMLFSTLTLCQSISEATEIPLCYRIFWPFHHSQGSVTWRNTDYNMLAQYWNKMNMKRMLIKCRL